MVEQKPLNKLSYFVIAYIFLTFGYSLSAVFFNQTQLWALSISFLFLILPFFKSKIVKLPFEFNTYQFLLIANLFTFIFFYIIDNGIYIVSGDIYQDIILLKFIALILFFFYFINFNLKGSNIFSVMVIHLYKHKFVYLILLAMTLRLLIIYGSPKPNIDVFWVLTGGAQSIMQGDNPYSQDFYNSYSKETCLLNYGTEDCRNDHYTYLPATLAITTIFFKIFGDVRFAQLFATFGMALVAYSLVKKRFPKNLKIPQLASLLVLYLPYSLFVLEQSWTDSISLFALYLFVFLTALGYKYLPYLIFGGMLAVKQLSWVFLGFILRLRGVSLVKYSIGIVTFAILIIPFVIWNFSDFFNDVIIHHIRYEPSHLSLTFNSVARIYFGQSIPSLFSLGLLLILFLFLIIKTKRDLSGIIHSSLTFLLALFILRQGFPNYYFSIAAGLVLLISLEIFKLPQEINEDQ